MKPLVRLGLFMLIAGPALPCTCVSAKRATAKTELSNYSVVFRGARVEKKVLSKREEMTRQRYALMFRVDEYWKGSPDRTLILYGMDSGTDCLGDGGYEKGKSYLVYASEQEAKDVILEHGFFWFGWTDVLPEGTHMLVPTACTPGGETGSVRRALRELGKGRSPKDD